MGTYTQRTKDVSQWTDRIENHGSTSQGRFGASQLITTLEAITEAQDNIDALDTAVTEGLTPDMDSIPTAGSQKPVTSAGIKAAIDTAVSGRQPLLTFDSTPTASSTNPVTSGGVHTALQGKQATLVVGTNLDNTPVSASTNPITSGGVYGAIQGLGNMTLSGASGTSLSAAVNTYYRFASAVTSLEIILPDMTGVTSAQGFVVHFSTGSSVAITITPVSGQPYYMYSGLSIVADKEYELNFVWNGAKWIIAYGEIVAWT